jgi:ABC-type Na+ efflux pump permease subunit
VFVARRIMNPLVSPWAIVAVCGLISLGLLASPNAVLRATSLLALPVAVWLLGGRQAYRTLLWVIAINWLLSLQLFAAGWQIYEAGDLSVYHDTELKHHQSPEITSGYIANAGLFAFLNYPIVGRG